MPFKDLPEGQTYSCEKHILDSEELNPRCHICGLLMRDDSDPVEKTLDEAMMIDFYKGNPVYEMGIQAERKRILNLPCMQEDEGNNYYDDRMDGKNDLRRELKEEINL